MIRFEHAEVPGHTTVDVVRAGKTEVMWVSIVEVGEEARVSWSMREQALPGGTRLGKRLPPEVHARADASRDEH